MKSPLRIIDAVRQAVQTATVRPLLAAQLQLDVGDRTAVEELAGPVIIVSNHASRLDLGVLQAALPARHRRRTGATVGSGRGLDPRLLLKAGRNVVIFPEGCLSTDGVAGGFGTDAAQLAIEQHVPVLPVGIRGTFAAMPQGRTWSFGLPFAHNRPRVSVRFGSVLDAEPDETATSFTSRIDDAVRTAIAEDRTTWWQSLRHGHDAATLPPAGSWRRIWDQSQSPRPGGRPRRPRIWRR